MSQKRFRAFVSSVALVASAGAVLVATDTSASAAQSTRITSVSPSKPIKGETFTVRGTIATELVRTVRLQRKTKSSWKTVKSGATSAAGKFSFQTSTSGDKTYRVVAPSARIDGRTYRTRVTQTRTVTPVSQTAKTYLSDTTIREGQHIVFTGKFGPVRKGRPAFIRIERGGEAESGPLSPENSEGKSYYGVTVGMDQAGTYTIQAFVPAWHGAPAKYGNRVTLTVRK